MLAGVDYGHENLDLNLGGAALVGLPRGPLSPALPDVGAAVREALESPIGFPALYRALTPEDYVAIVLDEGLPHLYELLVPVLEHVQKGRVDPDKITVVCQSNDDSNTWPSDLPLSLR